MNMTHEEAKTAINKMSLEKIMSFSALDIRALTDYFKDDLLMEIVKKGRSDKERLDVIGRLESQFFIIYHNRRPSPQILADLRRRVKFEMPLTQTPTPAEPSKPNLEYESPKPEHETLKAKYEALEEQQSQPKASSMQAAESDESEEEKLDEKVLYNKVSFEFFLRLLEQAGFDINNTGNKTRVGELWHMMTGKSADEIRRFCSSRAYCNNHTREDVKRLNELLSIMGITSISI